MESEVGRHGCLVLQATPYGVVKDVLERAEAHRIGLDSGVGISQVDVQDRCSEGNLGDESKVVMQKSFITAASFPPVLKSCSGFDGRANLHKRSFMVTYIDFLVSLRHTLSDAHNSLHEGIGGHIVSDDHRLLIAKLPR